MVTGSKELIRDINSTLILETIIRHGPISRANIAKELGLTKATVSAIVQTQLDRGLVWEIGSDDTSYGRKPILLQYCEDAGYAVCVDVGVEILSAIRTNLGGRKAFLLQRETPNEPEGLLQAIQELVYQLMEHEGKGQPEGKLQTGIHTQAETYAERATGQDTGSVLSERTRKETKATSRYGLVGIALGIHGAVKDNVVTFAPYYQLMDLNLAERLEQEFGVPVMLENEANLSVLGEESFVYDYPVLANISVHSGIGLGLLVNHELYTGYNGNAGEIGHTIIEVDGRPCPCGNHGCLEQYVSERVLLREFAKRKHLQSVDMDEFFEYYRGQDEDAREILDSFVRYMSVCVNNVLNSFNPDVVIINSLFVVNSPGLIRRIEESLQSRFNHYVKIVPSGLQDASILLGGICIVVKKFLNVGRLHFDFWGI